ncbi:hypothetical protein K2173_013657 [Erythroxylum novogranatense]|uniref:Chaperone DnaJ C-terminal domain-containing protein n=1 Tax=Erythroxylum novogranatense TaxID=1862640 RepID=A0AAV8TK53_9ROSI|nr:hypothetical protein K2173_013657 [Erythroxylum novogranatense]
MADSILCHCPSTSSPSLSSTSSAPHSSCNGDKVVRRTKTIKLDIIPGVDDGETIKVARCGGANLDKNQNGDLFVTIKAILGGTIQVPTLTGDVVLEACRAPVGQFIIQVRPGTQPGQKVVLKKKGIKARGSYAFGDQFVHFNVSIPMFISNIQT